MSHQHTYMQIRDVVERIRIAHQRLRDALERPQPEAVDSRTRHMLAALRREEQQLEIALTRQLNRDDSSDILDTWLQYIPDAELFETLESLSFDSEMSAEEVVAKKQQFDRKLIILLRQLREATAAPRVQEFFCGLERESESRVKRASWKLRDFQGEETPPRP